MKEVAAIILAAGRGRRMDPKGINKVVFTLGKKQMILHTVDLLDGLFIKPVIVVVGFAKESVVKILDGRVIFAEQKKRLGTAHAVSCALSKLPNDTKHVLVLNGDDSAFYKADTIAKLINTHLAKKASLSFLTIEVNNPFGLGRVIRRGDGKVLGIVEEKDATKSERKIKEINPACYIFSVPFLQKYLKKVKKSSVTGEYYLTSLIDLAISNKERVETIRGGNIPWRGVNTPDELREAEKIFLHAK